MRAKSEACPACREEVMRESRVAFCPRCWALFLEGGKQLTRHDGHSFNFADDGWFTHLGAESFVGEEEPPFRSYRERIGPTIEKLWGHAIWSLVWGVGTAIVWSVVAPPWLFWVFFVMTVLHLLLFGSYWSAVMMQSLLVPYYRPPPWENLTNLLRRGSLIDAQAEMKRLHLTDHPGFLVNLARAQLAAGDSDAAEEALTRAREQVHDHPFFPQNIHAM